MRLIAIGVSGVLGLLGVQAASAADDRQPVIRCEQLQGAKIASAAIHLKTRGAAVDTAVPSAAGSQDGDYCKVNGAIQSVDPKAQPIRFQVNLPRRWNSKAVHVGGGGYDGTLVDALTVSFAGAADAHPVAAGYATFGSDSGHQSSGFTDPAPAKFGLNEEELENFGGAQLKKTHDVALELIRKYYGASPRRMYFYGNSQGGHEGLTVAQRWPKDYDGVVSIHPAYNFSALQLSGLRVAQALYKSPAAWLSPPKVQLIGSSVLRSCDALDGVADGIISDVEGCRKVFKVESLRCADGKDGGDTCLSDVQIETVRVFDRPVEFGFALQGGVTSFARWPLLTGAFAGAPSFFTFGFAPAPTNPPTLRDAFLFFMADQMVRYMVVRDPAYNALTFEPAQHIAALKHVSDLIDASDANLDAFHARGGKLLLLHGTVDMAIAPENTVAYHDRLVSRYGKEPLRTFTRFFMVPGFGHGDGSFQMRWDGLSALDGWVDGGSEPLNPVATDGAPPTAGRTRPLCEYPLWPRYLDGGDAKKATSFQCTRS